MNRVIAIRVALLLSLTVGLTFLSTRIQADTAMCGGVNVTLPFTDVPASNAFFCSIAQAYFSGLANGTSPTTYNPTGNVSREQMAAFVTRTLDQSLVRGNRRAALRQWWTPSHTDDLDTTNVGGVPTAVESDGADLWVANGDGTVSRVRASDGVLTDTWMAATPLNSLLVAKGHIFLTGDNFAPVTHGFLYRIDPTQPTRMVTTVTSNLGSHPRAIAFDGAKLWTANFGDSSVSIVRLSPTNVTTLTGPFALPVGILYDGSNIWVADEGTDEIKKLDSTGNLVGEPILVGGDPQHPVFDGINIWVPNYESSSLSVVRVKDANGNPLDNPFVLTTLTGNGLDHPVDTAFDGQRILVTNLGNIVSLWKAADLTPLGSFSTGGSTSPSGLCSDGINFWITLAGADKLARF